MTLVPNIGVQTSVTSVQSKVKRLEFTDSAQNKRDSFPGCPIFACCCAHPCRERKRRGKTCRCPGIKILMPCFPDGFLGLLVWKAKLAGDDAALQAVERGDGRDVRTLMYP